ncbi:MAG: alpha/beta hydrolase [Candidatus Izemoplasmatales bacterium]|jgi:dipeptidyl aminopeptidase/acylaminoacyl peptidase
MEWYVWLPIILVVCFILVMGYVTAKSLYDPKRLTLDASRAKENVRSPGLMDIYDTWDIETFWIDTHQSIRLKAYFLPAEVDNNRYVVIAHGYSYTHHGAVKYAQMMRELGFHVLMYDERYHGESEGDMCTMGYLEQHDLYDAISYLYERFGPDIILGTYGESMGAATAILEHQFDNRVRFVISDCGFADLKMLLTYLYRLRHLPKYPFIWAADLCFYWKTKVRFHALSPIKAVKHAKVPMLFMHGESDRFIPKDHSIKMHEVCPTTKGLLIAPNAADHTEASRKNPELYREVLKDFLLKIQMITNNKEGGKHD